MRTNKTLRSTLSTQPQVSLSKCGTLSSHLAVCYLRMLPGGAAWLQSALGELIAQMALEAEDGLRLLTDPMEAYLCLAPKQKDEVDRDLERGEVAALRHHTHVVEALSAASAALCTRCESALEAILAFASAAPRGLRRLARTLRESAEGQGVHSAPSLICLLYNSYILPALAAPEAYGIVSGCAPGSNVVSHATRRNLIALCLSLEQLVSLVGIEESDAGGYVQRQYLTPRLLACGQPWQRRAHLLSAKRPLLHAHTQAGLHHLWTGGGALVHPMGLHRQTTSRPHCR